jgi:hypothetical protein
MKIPKKQWDRLLQHDPEAFVDSIIEFLDQESPELVEDVPRDSLREMVANGITRARSHGFHTDEDLMAFVAVMFEIAPNFDEHPEILRALRDETVPLEERFDAIFDTVSQEAWSEAELNYDPEAWFPELKGRSF